MYSVNLWHELFTFSLKLTKTNQPNKKHNIAKEDPHRSNQAIFKVTDKGDCHSNEHHYFSFEFLKTKFVYLLFSFATCLTVQPRLALNLGSFCFSLLRAWITGYTTTPSSFIFNWLRKSIDLEWTYSAVFSIRHTLCMAKLNRLIHALRHVSIIFICAYVFVHVYVYAWTYGRLEDNRDVILRNIVYPTWDKVSHWPGAHRLGQTGCPDSPGLPLHLLSTGIGSRCQHICISTRLLET